jgi:hypothetical protein
LRAILLFVVCFVVIIVCSVISDLANVLNVEFEDLSPPIEKKVFPGSLALPTTGIDFRSSAFFS